MILIKCLEENPKKWPTDPKIYYIRSKVHKRSPVTNALLAQPVGLETSCMTRFEGRGTRMSENSTDLKNFNSVAMET